jgi:pilus assembly protein Flp/PilA
MSYWYLYLKNLKNLVKDQEGQDLVEYALLFGLISLAAIVAITATGVSVNAIWTAISAALAGAVPT